MTRPIRSQTPGSAAALAIALALNSCGGGAPKGPAFETEAVGFRDIVVAVEAAGQIEPAVTVELKSKASGQILEVSRQTGEVIPAGTLLVQIDKRTPRNALAQAAATLEAAKARRSIAEAQAKRAAKLLEQRIINDVDFEQSQLEFANAKAEVVRSQVAVETARIQLDDTELRAPITGTLIERLVEPGQVISSPIMDVGGGTVLLKMADLTSVQVKALVDETDIGKIKPGLPAIVTVTAYPNQPFRGEVQKIEPLASANQTVTTFAVKIVLKNDQGLLKPGMNADVDILVAERRNVLAVPTAALRTERDLATSATLVGLTESEVREQLGLAGKADANASPKDGADVGSYQFGGNYWVFVKRGDKPAAVAVRTGLTDLDFNEVVSGLKDKDEVYLLPSSQLVETQQRMQEQMRRFQGMPGMNRGR